MSDKLKRQNVTNTLHPAIRKPVTDILKQLNSEGLNFEIFEAWRTPDLQQSYYAKGRNKSGKIVNKSKVVTYAKPWRSFHQYGLAVDLVLRTRGKWSWNDKGTNKRKWERMHEVAREHGMVPLNFEKPHIQIDSIKKSSQLFAGQYPEGGDSKWTSKLAEEILAWRRYGSTPPIPEDIIERPSLDSSPDADDENHTDQIVTGKEAYDAILTKVFELEGGYVNHPSDPGGPTNMGITLDTLAKWRGTKVTANDVRKLTFREAANIYQKNYFDAVNAGLMPAAVACHVFNTAVLSGTKRGGEIVQKALVQLGENVEIDGIVGQETLGAILRVDDVDLAEVHNQKYLKYLKRLPHWNKFGRGWTNRMKKVNSLAQDLAQSSSENVAAYLPKVDPSDDANKTREIPSRIYLFRGMLGSIFSAGLNDLAEKLNTKGHDTVVEKWTSFAHVKSEIVKDHTSGSLGSVILIGHSLGANTALKMASSLQKKGIEVAYVASLDPTKKRTVNGRYKVENFRSSDVRDKPILGATEFLRNDLNHLEIDGDTQIHNRIISICDGILSNSNTTQEKESNMSDMQSTRSGAGDLNDRGSSSDLEPLIAAIAEALSQRENDGDVNNKRSEILEVVQILLDRKKRTSDSDLTPVNSALGMGIGRLLNGKKTAIGIIGLAATFILPAIFPGSAPIQAILNALGLTTAAAAPEIGKEILSPIFGAILTWGGLGKFEKWFMKLRDNN